VADADLQSTNQRQSADDSQRSAQDAQQRARVHELEQELERYRQACEDTLQQLDWCIGYMHGCGKKGIARSLSRNRAYIRTHLLRRAEQPVPSQQPDER
jgi:predicted phage gp36 major capsid-like protein